MPHVPGIGGFVGQMSRGLSPLSIRDQRLTVTNSLKRGVCNLPAYEIGDLLVIQFVCANGLILSNFVFEGDAGWIPASSQLVTSTGTIHVVAGFYRFATDKSLTQVTYNCDASQDPNWAASAVSIIGADPGKVPCFSTRMATSSAATSHNPSAAWDTVPVGMTQYVAMGAAAASASVTAWPAEVPNSRLNNVAGTVRPHMAANKLAGGGLDLGAYSLSTSANFALQIVGAMGDS